MDPAQQAVPTVVVEEMIRGRFATIRQAEAGKGPIDLPHAYDLFDQSFRALAAFRTLPYTAAADALVQALRRAKVRVGTRDLRIAAICIVHGATLVTRNARDLRSSTGPDLRRLELKCSLLGIEHEPARDVGVCGDVRRGPLG
ncbi:type II toxin-antitoxin system VapC family toxin [Gemmata sp. SH-PL17]|uniref:type II toxin-antitoxin system VapC family toxin n=1 Tax=Gemmata sp. SH-PL17 TaxID=1630693 RepID=UPI0039656B7E